MPALPREDSKIVVRPRGGLNISKVGNVEVGRAIYAGAQVTKEELIRDVICPNYQQNIVIISTSKRENANRSVSITQIVVEGKVHEVSAYESAPHGMIKGVIQGVPLGDTVQEINKNIVNVFIPTAVEANRIGNTTSVVIAFNGPKVPRYVRYRACLPNACYTENRQTYAISTVAWVTTWMFAQIRQIQSAEHAVLLIPMKNTSVRPSVTSVEANI